VEPIYEKKIEILDELQNSDVVYGYHPTVAFSQATLAYPELGTFLDHKTMQEDCRDMRKCIERMITKRNIAIILSPFLFAYVAREMVTVDVGKIICSFDEDLISAGVTILFKEGNPHLDRFNILMRRYLEAGLMERLWTELQHRASLRGGGRFSEAAGDMFFAFSVSHLMPAFVVLLVGTVLSLVLFIGELVVNCLWKRRMKKKSRVRRVKVLY
jgi:hypothetical protein